MWWDDEALCARSADPDAWFELEDARDEGRPLDPVRLALALETCARCPIRTACLRRARPNDQGIWGGRTTAERRVATRDRSSNEGDIRDEYE